jgi:hypothetical protein
VAEPIIPPDLREKLRRLTMVVNKPDILPLRTIRKIDKGARANEA